MNKHLVAFFRDELENNEYYEYIREFAKVKNIDMKEIEDDIINCYEENINSFAPYRFMDAIEDFLGDEDNCDISKIENMYEVLERMWSLDYFIIY